jgi:hypothetical protein
MAVCKECQEGIHKHMDAMKTPGFDKLPRHEQLDGTDCKNLIVGTLEGYRQVDQCVCPEWIRFYRKSQLPLACINCPELDQSDFFCNACGPEGNKFGLCPKGKQLY